MGVAHEFGSPILPALQQAISDTIDMLFCIDAIVDKNKFDVRYGTRRE